jgi:hypothetical protein
MMAVLITAELATLAGGKLLSEVKAQKPDPLPHLARVPTHTAPTPPQEGRGEPENYQFITC